MRRSVPHPPQSPPPRPIVVVCGDATLVERVRSVLVDYGIACASASRPTALELPEDGRVVGWIRVGIGSPLPRWRRLAPWMLTVDREPAPDARLVLHWPDESRVLVLTVIMLLDIAPERPLEEVVAEQRVRHVLRTASHPLDGVSAACRSGVAYLRGRVACEEWWSVARRLAAGVPGIEDVAIEGGRAASDPRVSAGGLEIRSGDPPSRPL